MNRPLKVGLLAGESSGDILGAGLMAEILKQHPTVEFHGIGGPLMSQLGLKSQTEMERLSVMGLIEPLKRLPELLRIRKRITQFFLSNPPDVFIGIDSPEFNLGIEKKLRKTGIPIVHYVSPSVWAWRENRIKKIAKAVDLVLTLFPFELKIYQQHNIPAYFVGHPIADEIPLEVSIEKAKEYFSLPSNRKVLALLPGSRENEVQRLAPAFLKTAAMCLKRWPHLSILLPCANPYRRQQLETLIDTDYKGLNVTLVDGQSREVMAAADCILIASGTATLEALLLKKPMLVCHRMSNISYAIISRLLKIPYFSLPNLLAEEKLVDELVQDEVNEKLLFKKILELMNNDIHRNQLHVHYNQIHKKLRKSASKEAARQILKLIS